jgi:hypothetical protein
MGLELSSVANHILFWSIVISAHQYHKRVPQQGFPPDQAHSELVIFQKGTEGTTALVLKELPLFHYQCGHIVLLLDMKLQHYPCNFLVQNVAVDSVVKVRELS